MPKVKIIVKKAVNADDIITDAIKRYGYDAQIDLAIEEMAELIKSIIKYRRAIKFRQYNPNDCIEAVRGELADVYICLRYIERFFGSCEENIEAKFERLAERLRTEAQ